VNNVDQQMDCQIGVSLLMVLETSVDYPQVEYYYHGRNGQIGDIRMNEPGFVVRYGPKSYFWDESDGPIAMDLGVEKPQFDPNMTPFYVEEEYSIFLRFKHLE
jgi:hypothetical protein